MKRRIALIVTLSVIVVAFLIHIPVSKSASKLQSDWPVYGGDSEDNHYSPLSQINKSNVSKLQVAWTYDSGEAGGIETSPIMVGNVLYTYTPKNAVVAVDAATGKVLWKFDSGLSGGQVPRAVTYWSDGKDSRILAGVRSYVYALDAETGQPIKTFGEGGRIDLREGLGREPVESQSVYLTSPGIIYKDLLITGGRNPEGLPAPPGDIRAYDVRTGALRWQFHTIPHPGEPGYETWPKDAWTYEGASNNWAGMAVDQKRGIVFAPTGSAAPDFLGMDRIGDDLYSNCELALNAETGRLIWYFQAVHHDLWDRDFPSPPTLLTVKHNGKMADAVAQTTKHGVVYVFNRETGEPLFPIENRDYPPSMVPGEAASKQQPMPTKPAPFARQLLTEDMLTNRTPEAHAWAVQQFEAFRSYGQFVPLSVGKDTVVFPGFDGGAEWGGSAADPQGILYVNANDIAWTGALAENSAPGRGQAASSDPHDSRNMPYRFTGYKKFYDPDGYPAVVPPWGTLNAINLNTGEYVWKIPLGEYPALSAQGLKDTGTENYGGPIVTAGGIVIIAATNFDKKIRAFDKDTGKLLWEATLPYSGNATPATYMVNGRQYVVIAATGAKGTPADAPRGVYVAFALPK